jgi:hypothetical protein
MDWFVYLLLSLLPVFAEEYMQIVVSLVNKKVKKSGSLSSECSTLWCCVYTHRYCVYVGVVCEVL